MGLRISAYQHYKGLRYNVIRITRGREWSDFEKEGKYITLEWLVQSVGLIVPLN